MSELNMLGTDWKRRPSIQSAVLLGLLKLQRDRERAASIMTALLAGELQWDSLGAAQKRLLAVPLIDLVLHESFKLRYKNAARMVSLAEKAQILARNLSSHRYGRKVVADIRARVWSDSANAYRVAEDFPSAERALGLAAAWVRRGTGDPVLFARVLDFGASLFSDQRCFTEASECLDCVESIYEMLGEVQLAARALVSKGVFAGRDGQHKRAIILLSQGLKRASAWSDTGLELVALQSLALNLVELGDYQTADAAFERLERLFRRDRGIINSLRLHWLKGRIAVGLGQFGQAESCFQVARIGFRNLDKFVDAALVSLDLALVYAKRGKRLEIRQLAQEMITTFRAYRIAREAIASLVLLRKTCDEPESTPDLLRGQIKTLSLMLAELERRPVRGR